MSHAAGDPERDDQPGESTPYGYPAGGPTGAGDGAAAPQDAWSSPPGTGYGEPAQGHGAGYAGTHPGAGYAGTQPGAGAGNGGGTWSGVSGAGNPPPGTPGVFEGPVTGQPISPSDQKLWAILAQLSVVIGLILGAGMLGWLGPLIIFIVFKDRDRFVRFHAAEALNMSIAVLIVNTVLGIIFGILTVITFGFGAVLFSLLGIPALVHVIFAIIGAVKANELRWWPYPANIRILR